MKDFSQMLSLRCTEYIPQGKHLGRKKKSKKHLSTLVQLFRCIEEINWYYMLEFHWLHCYISFTALILPYVMIQCSHKIKITVVFLFKKSHKIRITVFWLNWIELNLLIIKKKKSIARYNAQQITGWQH